MLLINCSLFLPLVHFPVILPSRMSRSNTSCLRTCPSHLRFRWFIVLMIQLFSLTRFRTSELLTFDVQLIFSIFLHIHISKASILFITVFDIVHNVYCKCAAAAAKQNHLSMIFVPIPDVGRWCGDRVRISLIFYARKQVYNRPTSLITTWWVWPFQDNTRLWRTNITAIVIILCIALLCWCVKKAKDKTIELCQF